LAQPTSAAGEINGMSYTQYFGNIAAIIGTQLDTATGTQQVQQSAVAQAQNVRQQISGVSLDQEATILVQFQRAYEASSKLITILDQLTEDTINILPN
jgi:flagellar hook-associated protein 1